MAEFYKRYMVIQILTSLIFNLGHAQDLIVKKDGETIHIQLDSEIRTKGFNFSLATGSLNDPIFGGNWHENGTEFIFSSKNHCWDGRVGYEYIKKNWGIGIDFACWKSLIFDDITVDGHDFSNLTYHVFFFDLAIHAIPISFKSIGFGLYGIVGLGSKYSSYTAYGSDFKGSVFNYCFGFGSRIYFFKWLSLMVEYRWIPGIDSHLVTFNKSGSKWTYGNSSINYWTKAASLGLILTI
jgi:hypothetical protein